MVDPTLLAYSTSYFYWKTQWVRLDLLSLMLSLDLIGLYIRVLRNSFFEFGFIDIDAFVFILYRDLYCEGVWWLILWFGCNLAFNQFLWFLSIFLHWFQESFYHHRSWILFDRLTYPIDHPHCFANLTIIISHWSPTLDEDELKFSHVFVGIFSIKFPLWWSWKYTLYLPMWCIVLCYLIQAFEDESLPWLLIYFFPWISASLDLMFVEIDLEYDIIVEMFKELRWEGMHYINFEVKKGPKNKKNVLWKSNQSHLTS